MPWNDLNQVILWKRASYYEASPSIYFTSPLTNPFIEFNYLQSTQTQPPRTNPLSNTQFRVLQPKVLFPAPLGPTICTNLWSRLWISRSFRFVYSQMTSTSGSLSQRKGFSAWKTGSPFLSVTETSQICCSSVNRVKFYAASIPWHSSTYNLAAAKHKQILLFSFQSR